MTIPDATEIMAELERHLPVLWLWQFPMMMLAKSLRELGLLD